MYYSIYQYYLFILTAISIFIAYSTPILATEVLVYLCLNFILLKVYDKNSYFKIPLFFFLATIFGGIVFRAFTIYNNMESYRYYLYYPLKEDRIIELALQNSLIGAFIIIIGFSLITLGKPKKKYAVDWRYSLNFIKNKNLIIIMLFFLVGLKLFIHLGLGLGQKGIKPTGNFMFLPLIRLIPPELPFVVVSLFLLKYNKFLTWIQKRIFYLLGILSILSVAATGGKTFVINFALCFSVYYLYTNKKIKVSHFTIISIVGFFVLTFSIVISSIIRYELFRKNTGLAEAFDLAVFALQTVEPYDILGHISMRFSGLDGQILLEQSTFQKLGVDWTNLYPVYQPSNILIKIFDNVLPINSIRVSKLPSMGVAVGKYVLNYEDSDAAFGGALGLFGSVKLISQFTSSVYYLLLLAWGMLMGWYFNFINEVQDSELKFILYFFGTFMVLHMSISGNFDLLFSVFIIKVVLLLIYSFIILILRKIIKGKTLTTPSTN